MLAERGKTHMKSIKDLKVSEMDLFQPLKKEYIIIFNNYYIIPMMSILKRKII